MAEEVEVKYRIPLFDGTNFGNWEFRMLTLLNELDLIHYTEKEYTEMVEFLEADKPAETSVKEAQVKEHTKRDKKCCS